MEEKKEKLKVPKHVGLILDGNRRWARERNLSTFEGHKKGYQIFKKVPGWFFSKGVEIVSGYIFSTENWNRSRDEVNYLMKLIKEIFISDFNEIKRKGHKLIISGRINELPGDLPEICQTAMEETKNNINGTINICLNYGGHLEIVDAVKKIIYEKKAKLDEITEELIHKHLYNDLPDPDIIVRTSGEQRLSGFLLWQSAYSELLFLKKYWPDFEENDVKMIVEEYGKRKRRFGGN